MAYSKIDLGPKFIDRYALAQMLGMSAGWVGTWRGDPSKPRYVVAGRKAWYRRDEVLAWLNSQEGAQALSSAARQGTVMKTYAPEDALLEKKFQQEWGSDVPEGLRLVPDPVPDPVETRHRDEVDEQADFSFVTADRHATVADALAQLDSYQLKMVTAFIEAMKAAK